ncbi:MAG: hypothetical protein WC718_17610 [Phycisphaerales bacterium]|jgi:hypothetical protein
MSPGWVGFIVGAFVGAWGGIILFAPFALRARRRAERASYLDGLAKGKELGRKAVWCEVAGDLRTRTVHDIIASDTASTGADRRPAA